MSVMIFVVRWAVGRMAAKKKKREMRRKKNFGKNEEEKIKYLQEKRLM